MVNRCAIPTALMLSVKVTVGALLLLTVLISVPMAYATPPTSITGKFTVTSSIAKSIRFADGNTIVEYQNTAVSVGDNIGTYLTNGVTIVHPDGSGRFHETATFTGSVLGRTGTFLNVASGTFKSDGSFKASGTIISGTGGLATLHGEFTF